MREIARAGLISASFLLLASPPIYGSTGFAFLTTTIQLVVIVAVLTITWDRIDGSSHAVQIRGRRTATAIVALTAATLAILACRIWLREVMTQPVFGDRPGMLILIQNGVRRILQGRNPYSTYDLPWKTTLSYGPLLWGPYALPIVLRADLRFAALAGALFLPLAAAFAAALLAWRGRIVAAAAWTSALAIIVINPELRLFASIAHTPVYWPLLGLLAWLVARDRWLAAAVACGLLIAAQTTMIAMAPVLLIATWQRDRKRFLSATGLLVTTAVVPFLPFAIGDWRALEHALHDIDPQVMKTVVWPAGGARGTVGVTGLLLRAGLGQYVEVVQVSVLLAVYAAAWRAIGNRRRPLPWLPASLFAFSATTLWPVLYLYFDVFVLYTFAALVEVPPLGFRHTARGFSVVAAAAAALLCAVTFTDVRRDVDFDVGTAEARPYLHAGFAGDETAGRTFTWVDGSRATIVLPRRSRRDADLMIVCQPNLPTRDARQQMSVSLNGTVLGTVDLREGWQPVSFPAPSRAWVIGPNELTLSFSNAVSPLSLGASEDARLLSVAFDRIAVRSK